MDVVDERGVRGLTMRAVGARLGVEAMALYRHVPSREQLLDSVVEAVVDELYGDPEVHLLPADGWRDYLRRLAHGVRRMALAHPQVFSVVATRPPAAPWVRPPLRSLRWIESFLEGLASRGFSDETAIYAYRAFTSFLLGHLLLEVGARGADVGPLPEHEHAPTPHPPLLDGYPRLIRLADKLAEDHSAEEFEESLTSLLDRLESARRGGVDGQRIRSDEGHPADQDQD